MKGQLTELREVVAINSYEPEGVKELASYYSSVYKSLGFRVKKDRFNNIAAIRGKPTILFNAHLDTVSPTDNMQTPFSLKRKGDWVYGLGVADNKAALVALHSVMEKTLPTNVAIVLSANEDNRITYNGKTKRSIYFHLQKNKYAVKRGINCEPTGAGMNTHIYDAIGGKLVFDVTSTGKELHSSSQSPHDSSILKAAGIIGDLYSIRKGSYSHHGKRFRTTVNVGMIKGGTGRNIIAGKTAMKCERRLLPNEDVKLLKREIRRASGKIDFIDEVPPFAYGRDDSFKQRVSESYKKAFGKQAAYSFTPISTDSSLFWLLNRIKLITVGPGELESAHTSKERLNLKQFKKVINFYSELVIE